MRIRSIKPEFWTDRTTGRWDVEMKLTYIALWNVADDDGRFEYEPDLLRAAIFPFGAPFCLETVLARIAETGKLRLYSVDGLMYGAIPSFKTHQWQQKYKPSKLPPPPDADAPNPPAVLATVAVRPEYGTSTVETRSGKGRDRVGIGKVVSSVPQAAREPAKGVVTFSCVGTGAREYPVTSEQVAEWAAAYPGLDVLAEVRKARVWIDANQRKTAKGMPRFLVNWLNRAQNRNPQSNRRSANAPDPAILKAIADAERDAAAPEPLDFGPIGDGGDAGGRPFDSTQDGLASIAALVPSTNGAALAHRRGTGQRQDPDRPEHGAGHGVASAAGTPRDA